MKTAYRRCIELGADVVVKMDADGQMDPGQLTALLDPIVDRGCDYTKGNRFLDSKALADMPFVRLWGNLALTFLTKMASGYWHVFDPQNGYVACPTRVLRRLDLDALANDYFFENDMLVHLNILECRVADVPMPARYGGARSSLRIGRVIAGFPRRLFGALLEADLPALRAARLLAGRAVSARGDPALCSAASASARGPGTSRPRRGSSPRPGG